MKSRLSIRRMSNLSLTPKGREVVERLLNEKDPKKRARIMREALRGY